MLKKVSTSFLFCRPPAILTLFIKPTIVLSSASCSSAFSCGLLLKSNTLDFCLLDKRTGKLFASILINSYLPLPGNNLGSLFSSKLLKKV